MNNRVNRDLLEERERSGAHLTYSFLSHPATPFFYLLCYSSSCPSFTEPPVPHVGSRGKSLNRSVQERRRGLAADAYNFLLVGDGSPEGFCLHQDLNSSRPHTDWSFAVLRLSFIDTHCFQRPRRVSACFLGRSSCPHVFRTLGPHLSRRTLLR